MNNMKKKDYISFVLLSLLTLLLVVFPVFFWHYMKYFTFIYIIFGSISIILLKGCHVSIKRSISFWLLIFVNCILLLVHFRDFDTVVNLSMLLLSYLSLFFIVSKGVELYGSAKYLNLIFKYIVFILVLSLVVSPILTMLGWPAAPQYFPWEAFFSDKRFLLITGKGVGHSNAMWLMAFTAIYLLHLRFSGQSRFNFVYYIFIGLLLFGLYATKSRMALFFIGIIAISFFCYVDLVPRFLFVVVSILVVVLFYLSILYPYGTVRVVSTISEIQSHLPGARLTVKHTRSSQEESVYNGRYILNRMLFNVIKENPFTGAGHSDVRLKYGVDEDGFIAYDPETKAASSESGIRVLAKYGMFYYVSLLFFIITPMSRALRCYYIDNNFVIANCSIVLVSSIGGTIFENLYSISGLFAIIIIMLTVMEPNK